MRAECLSVDRVVPGAQQVLNKYQLNGLDPQTNVRLKFSVSGHLLVGLGDEGRGMPPSLPCTSCRAGNPDSLGN